MALEDGTIALHLLGERGKKNLPWLPFLRSFIAYKKAVEIVTGILNRFYVHALY